MFPSLAVLVYFPLCSVVALMHSYTLGRRRYCVNICPAGGMSKPEQRPLSDVYAAAKAATHKSSC